MIGDEAVMDGTAARAGMRVALVGPDKPSFSEPWLANTPFAGAVDVELPRYPDLLVLREQLAAQGVL